MYIAAHTADEPGATAPARPPALNLVRLPGPAGPILRCSGDLTLSTVESLRRELDLLASLGHRVLTLNLANCRMVDIDGLMLVIDALKRLHARGQSLMLVGGGGAPGRTLRLTGLDAILPTFPTERAAEAALRGLAVRDAGPRTWEAARAATLTRWRALYGELDTAPTPALLRGVSAMSPLCQRSETALEKVSGPEGTRCFYCPLYRALGGRAEDVGCGSVRDPLVESLLAGDRSQARGQVAQLIQLLETMSLPASDAAPAAQE